MKRIMQAVAILVLVALAAAPGRAQEKQQEKDRITPLKVQVVFSEMEGDKKVASMPYTLLVNASDGIFRSDASRIRVGVRVPIVTQGKDGPTTQYLDVGTNIDARAGMVAEGRILLEIGLRRSSIHTPTGDKAYTNDPTPMFRNFDSEMKLIFRDGETIQSTMATDPVSGRILRVDVTLTVLK